MKQLEFFDIPSPCIGICESGARGFCRGCFRSREERQFWYQADDAAKRLIIRACQVRKLRYERALAAHPPDAAMPAQVSLFPDVNDLAGADID